MGIYYDEQITRDIEARIDIVELISETVDLSRKGNRYWGLCPFHQEKTPSFSVSRERQMFYCFGCHAGGNLFSFVMKRNGIDFKEACELLAAKAGIELVSPRDKKKFDTRKQIITVNNAATEYFHQMLLSNRGQLARNYLEKRGIAEESISIYKLGYAPDEWNGLEEYLLKKGVSLEWVKLSGLIKRNDNQNRFYDLFRNRIIFPIYQYNHDIVGFGGRILGEGNPKYLNTPETDLFSKRKNLYGLAQAHDSIRQNNEAILVEGYMDCIKLQQSGITNVVASLGTALTQEQAGLFKRYAEKVLILYDGDEAGQRETLRAIDVLVNQEIKVDVISLPAGQDPDEYIEKNGKKEFWQYIQNNRYSYIEFKMNRYINSAPVYNLESKISIINQLRSDIINLHSALERDHYIKILSRKLRVEEDLVNQEIKLPSYKGKDHHRNKIEIIRDNNKYGNYGIQEKIMVAMLKDNNTFTKVKQRIGLKFFANPDYRVLANIYDRLQEENGNKMYNMSHMAIEEGLEASWARISLMMDLDNPDEAREVEEFIRRVENKKAEIHWQKALSQIDKLSETGNFNSVLNLILNLDAYTNVTREGVIS